MRRIGQILGDAVCVACLFGMLYAGLLFGSVMQ